MYKMRIDIPECEDGPQRERPRLRDRGQPPNSLQAGGRGRRALSPVVPVAGLAGRRAGQGAGQGAQGEKEGEGGRLHREVEEYIC